MAYIYTFRLSVGGLPHTSLNLYNSTWNVFASPGSVSGKNIQMQPMPLPPPQSSAYSMPPPSIPGNHTPANSNQMLDYLESQVRGMDMTSPLLQVCNCLSSNECTPSYCHSQLLICKSLLLQYHSYTHSYTDIVSIWRPMIYFLQLHCFVGGVGHKQSNCVYSWSM